MPTTLLSQGSHASQTYSTELARNHYPYPNNYPYASKNIISRGADLSETSQDSTVESASIVHDVDRLSALIVGSAAANSVWMSRLLTQIGEKLELDVRIAAAASILNAGYLADEAVSELWSRHTRQNFRPMIGQVTQAGRMMASLATSGRIRSSEIIPRFEED